MNHSKHHRNRKQRPKPHKDWRLWFVVGLMLLSMIAYAQKPKPATTVGSAISAGVGNLLALLR